MTKSDSKRGFALPAAVLALVLVGVLVTSGYYLARQETRIGVASKRSAEAFYLAERGANEVMYGWDMTTFGGLSSWSTATVSSTVGEGLGWSVDVTKMTDRLYFLQATGTVTAGSGTLGNASRMIGRVARLNSVDIMPDAALTTIGDIRIQGSTEIIGHDTNPTNWAGLCEPPGQSKPGILIDDLNSINEVGNALTVDGVPPQLEDPSLTSEDLLTFGNLDWDDLVALADKRYHHDTKIRVLAPDSVDVGGGEYVCDEEIRDNWGTPGKPAGACGAYFPIIYAEGDLEIAANERAQGILLVEGDLKISGTHIFYGPVIIKGTLWASGGGTGGHFIGGVITGNVDLESTRITGNAVIEFSSCAVNRAILNNSSLTRVRPLENRSWVDLSSVNSG